MRCANCGIEISGSFKHAIQKNECPSCGNFILDEETLALIESVKDTICSEAPIRPETAHNIANVLIAKYNISFNGVPITQSVKEPNQPKPVQNKTVLTKSATRSMTEEDIIRIQEIPDDISVEERDRMLEDAVRKKYSMVDQVEIVPRQEDMDNLDEIPESVLQAQTNISSSNGLNSLFSNDSNDVLEKERLQRLAKQQRAMSGSGSGPFRRGS